jgi:hypothetical protein
VQGEPNGLALRNASGGPRIGFAWRHATNETMNGPCRERKRSRRDIEPARRKIRRHAAARDRR